jgi:signal peptidase I
MAPTVKSGDALVALLAPMHTRAVHRFDLVVFDLPPEFARENAAWHALPWMKRLVGLPGEHVQIDGSGITVAGEKLSLPVDVGAKPLNVQLGADEYFVLGDNLNHSVDSRSFGPLKRGLLRGYVWHVIHHHS